MIQYPDIERSLNDNWINADRITNVNTHQFFKSEEKYKIFHIVLIFLGKDESNYSPSSNELVVGQTRLLKFDMATSLREGKLWIQTLQKNLPCLIFCPCRLAQ